MKLDNDSYITSLYFSEFGYGWPEEVYEYKFKNDKGKIIYKFYSGKESPVTNVRDINKFSKQVFEIIKTWKRKYYWKGFTICDGTMWELRIKLSNGKYLRYEGHQMFPENYKNLRGYLNRFVGKYAKEFKEDYLKYLY